MPRTRAEIQADIERLQGELSEAVDDEVEASQELGEVLEEAVKAHEEAAEEAAEEVTEEITEAIEEAAEEAVEESPLTDDPDDMTATVAARVIDDLQERYELTPREPVAVVEETHTTVTEEPTPVETAPHSEHWSRRRIF